MESQIVNKKRIYRGFQEGDTGYYKGIKGKISIDKDTPTSFKIDWHSENIPHYTCFTLEGKFMKADKDPSLSFLPDEQSMPFDEVEVLDRLPEKYSVIAYTDEQKNKLICYLEEHVKNLIYESPSDSVFHISSSKYFASSSNCKLDGHILISFEDWERLVKAEKTTYKGQLEGVPNDIVERMMDCQEEQGNKRDASVFEKFGISSDVECGFYWFKTKEGQAIWEYVIRKKNFQPFYEFWEKENKKEKSKMSYGNFVRFGFPHYCSHEIEYITPEYQKKVITNKINKIETKLSKLNGKREKLLERYKSLG